MQRNADTESGSQIDELPELSDLRFGERIRYELMLPLNPPDEPEPQVTGQDGAAKSNAPLVRILVSLPPSYPATSPPQLQLLGRYLGQFTIDPAFFGDVTRTYITQSGPGFTAGDVCIFDGIEYVLATSRKWYTARTQEGKDGEKAREMDRHMGRSGRAMAVDFEQQGEMGTEEVLSDSNHLGPTAVDKDTRESIRDPSQSSLMLSNPPMASPLLSDIVPAYIHIFSAPPITASRSVFIGHACRITDPLSVPSVIHQLLSDRKIAKATHPVIHAYRIIKEAEGTNGQVIMSDNDDDGESAAGGRLAHLLQILELENVLVVVSRWYGGVLLGPERFKLINQAARDALELGGFLNTAVEGKKKHGKGKEA